MLIRRMRHLWSRIGPILVLVVLMMMLLATRTTTMMLLVMARLLLSTVLTLNWNPMHTAAIHLATSGHELGPEVEEFAIRNRH